MRKLLGVAASNAADATTKADLDLKAPLASPTFTGTPNAPTPGLTDVSTKLATTSHTRQINGLNLASLGSVDLNGATGDASEFTGRRVAVNGTIADTAAADALNWPRVTGVVWWNVDTFGPTNRVTQFAYYGFSPTATNNRVLFRQRHDTTWGKWREILMQPPDGNRAFELQQSGANDVNYLFARSAPAGSSVQVTAAGADATINTFLRSKGAPSSAFVGSTVQDTLEVYTPANAVNRIRIAGSITGAAIEVQPFGTDGNIDVSLLGKGTGAWRAVTQAAADNSTKLATTAYVDAAVSAVSGGSGLTQAQVLARVSLRI